MIQLFFSIGVNGGGVFRNLNSPLISEDGFVHGELMAK